MKQIKTAMYILIISVVYFIGNAFIGLLMPYSLKFQELVKGFTPSTAAYAYLLAMVNALLIWMLSKYSVRSKFATITFMIISIFIVDFFTTQLETFYFKSAFPALETKDVFLLMLSGLLPVSLASLLGAKLFWHGNLIEGKLTEIKVNSGTFLSLLIITVSYPIYYFVFGYYIAWRHEEVREFYSGLYSDSFVGQLNFNYKEMAEIFPFQIMRGALFGIGALMLWQLLPNNNTIFILTTVIIFSIPGMMLLIPNPLFPDQVRWQHFKEVTSSMILFGITSAITIIKFSGRKMETGEAAKETGIKTTK